MGEGRYTEFLRAEAASIWDAIMGHPFLVEMSKGSLPIEKFRFYIVQDYAYLIDFVRLLGIILDKVEDIATMRAFVDRLNVNIRIELDALEEFGERIGVSVGELRRREMAPACMGYTRHLLHVAHSGTALETVTAMLPCVWSYGEISEKIRNEEGVKAHPIYNEWCETYASKEYMELVDWYRAYVDERARDESEATRRRMIDHFITSSRYEYLFWDMAYNEEWWPV
jgi:thiaminase/transcriptional activator TenA